MRIIAGLPQKEYQKLWRHKRIEQYRKYDNLRKKKDRAEHPEKCRLLKLRHSVKHRDQIAARSRAWNRKLRGDVLSAYGHECICCHEKREQFLTIEHINGGGTKHRKAVNNFYHFLRKAGFPKEEYTLLCMNCNWATRYKKPCPHKEEIAANVS